MKNKASAVAENDVDRLESINKHLRHELRELQYEKEALEQKADLLKSNLSSLDNQIKSIRGSLTFRVGSLVVNSRTPRGLVRLPWRLLKIYLEYRSTKDSFYKKEVNSDHANEAEVLESRAVYDQLWVGVNNSKNWGQSFQLEATETNLLTGKCLGGESGQLFEFSLEFENGLPPFRLKKQFSIRLNELAESGEVLSTRELSSPVNSSRSAHAFVGNEHLALSFVHRIVSPSCVGLTFDIELPEDQAVICDKGSSLEVHYRVLNPGVTVVIPSFKGESTIIKCLRSLEQQSLDNTQYEVLVIFNGPPDSSEKRVADYIVENPELNVRVLKSDVASAGNARNIGLSNASFEYITFVDDDDFVSENYLESLLSSSSYDSISVASVLDVDASGQELDNVINQQLVNAKSYKSCRYSDVSSVLTMNACKMLPTSLAAQLRYSTSLRSGEDVCYFTRYITRFRPAISLEPVRLKATYFRFLTGQSVSRQPASFSFNVEERLEVIQSIDQCLPFISGKEEKDFLISKIMAQSNFIQSYLDNHPEDVKRYADLVQLAPINFRYDKQVASSLANVIVYSYCFAPYIDTAGIVMAKRIREMGAPVDVVCNTMEGVREIDERLDRITAGLVGRTVTINGKPSFSSWPEIRRFADEAQKAVNRIEKVRASYGVIYSRAMWVASHFAAALHKVSHPSIIWKAEFSDPILKDVHGNDRNVSLELGWLKKHGVLSALSSRGFELPDSNNLFYWCEFLVYALADEIVFTNKNQARYMLSYSGLTDEEIESVKGRSTIQHHPSLPNAFYNLSNPSYEVDERFVNIAYFGAFYSTRGLSELFRVIKNIGSSSSKIKVHIFTSHKAEVISEASAMGVSENVLATDYVAFIDFLALTNRFDCLIVNDAVTEGGKCINPYLPSKLSDYMGSQSDIWAIVEKGSVLHEITQADASGRMQMSIIGDQDSYLQVLKRLLIRKVGNE